MSKKKRKVSSKQTGTSNNQNTSWAIKRCALAAAIAGALSVGTAYGQDDATEDATDETTQEAEAAAAAASQEEAGTLEEVIVTSMRSNLETSQYLKRNADTVIESITADELGSFPDKSVAEALQRVAGITVNRFAASSDTAHFSAEPSGVIVRGLDMVRTEFNGRDTFSANSSRGLSWGDVSPELMSGVDTYKNQMAELIEGGIAGTVNMRTRVPFDQADQTLALSLGANYGDLAEETTPEASGLWSDRWDLSNGGEIGLMANLAYSEVETNSEGIQLYRMNRFRDIYPGQPLTYIPAKFSALDNTYNRERTGASMAFQWADKDDRFLFTTQYNRSEYENRWEEYGVVGQPADLSFAQSVFFELENQTAGNWDATVPAPAPGTDPFTFDSNGLFQSGVMTTGAGWWGGSDAEAAGFAANSAGQQMVNPCYGWNGCNPQVRGVDSYTVTRSNNNENFTQDLSFNLKWVATDTIRTNFDVQWVDSDVQNYDINTEFYTFANLAASLEGSRPTFEFQTPTNVNQSPGGLSNPNNYYIRSIMDHVEDSEGEQLALRADMEIDLDMNWLESVKFGARYADRDQTVRWSTYNWQNVSNTWTGTNAPYWNTDRGPNPSTGFAGYPADLTTLRTFESGFYGGGVLTGQNTFVFANMAAMQDQQGYANAMSNTALGLSTGWDPICSNVGDRADEIPGTCYTPAEISDVTETVDAFYVQLNFGGDDTTLFGVPVSGNIGVRYVGTDNKSTGGIAYPLLSSDLFYELVPNPDYDPNDPASPELVRNALPRAYENLGCYPNEGLPGQPPPSVPNTLGCYISESDYTFMDGADELNTAEAEHEDWLPSFNIKFDLTEEWLVRFAWSRAMARPDIGNMKNYVGLSGTLPDANDANDPLWIKDANGQITGANVRYSGGTQNPFLSPIIADQYDIAVEYYFADVGSLTLTYFDKEFDDYIQFGTFYRDLTNNGETKTAEIRGPLNSEGAGLKGFEIAFQRFFDFLPEPFDGLGVQANYTKIDNDGITNTGTTEVGSGDQVTGQAPDQVVVDRLEGLSDDSYTLIGMYEKGDWAARLAWSWRSEYLVTAIDCCVAYPIWQDDYGQLDGSLRWRLSDTMEFMLSGSNLTNEETVLTQQVTNAEDGGLRLPNAWFQNDRRYTLSFRYFNSN